MRNNAIPIHPAPTWQEALRQCIGSSEHLLAILGLNPLDVGLSYSAGEDFPVKVTHSFAGRMQPGDPRDPLLLQVLASSREEESAPGFNADPVGELAHANPLPGILHKYNGRVLLLVTAGCAIHCRYCFRRHFPYGENRISRDQWQQTLEYIAQDQSIEEVILSGGDPLVATDPHLASLVEAVAGIEHVKRLRIHTRLPIVLPQRVTGALLDAIVDPRLQTIMVVHCNHANEIDTEVANALALLREKGITLLNQAVLLAGINDTVKDQANLHQTLFRAGVLPYYLHLLDKVSGAAHFDVPEPDALALLNAMRAQLPGYMVPRLVKEQAGETGKTPLAG